MELFLVGWGEVESLHINKATIQERRSKCLFCGWIIVTFATNQKQINHEENLLISSFSFFWLGIAGTIS